MAFIKKYIDLSPYKDLDTLLKIFRYYGADPIQVGKNHDEYLCYSPFTLKERTPSCRIASLKKDGIWGFKDFSSGKAGDVFSLIMTKQNVNFNTALWIVMNKIAPQKNPKFIVYYHPSQYQIPFPLQTEKTNPS